jgi:hypothetical protein
MTEVANTIVVEKQLNQESTDMKVDVSLTHHSAPLGASKDDNQENKMVQLKESFMIGEIEIYAEDNLFFYGKINQYEYSIDKTTTEIYIKNVDTDEWQPINNQQEQIVDVNMMALFMEGL